MHAPPDLPTPCHVLFQGDSITHAHRKPDEINVLFQLGGGYAAICAACLDAQAAPGRWRWSNRGVCGDGVAGLAARWDRDCIDLQPDLLSILIGTNDAVMAARGNGPIDGSDFAPALDALLTRARAANPALQVVVLEPFQLPVPELDADAPTALAPRQAAARTVAGDHGALFIPLQERLAAAAGDDLASICYDGVHPTARGHWLIAAAWLAAVAGVGLPGAGLGLGA